MDKTHTTPTQTNQNLPFPPRKSQQEARTHQVVAAEEAQQPSAATAALGGTAHPTLLQVCSNHCN